MQSFFFFTAKVVLLAVEADDVLQQKDLAI